MLDSNYHHIYHRRTAVSHRHKLLNCNDRSSSHWLTVGMKFYPISGQLCW